MLNDCPRSRITSRTKYGRSSMLTVLILGGFEQLDGKKMHRDEPSTD